MPRVLRVVDQTYRLRILDIVLMQEQQILSESRNLSPDPATHGRYFRSVRGDLTERGLKSASCQRLVNLDHPPELRCMFCSKLYG